MKLNEGKTGDAFMIVNIKSDFNTRKRLQDMGLTNGAKVRIMAYYPNNAYTINVRGSRIVIGKDLAETIEVLPVMCDKKCRRKRFRGYGRI